MDKLTQEQMAAIYQTASNLLKISHHLGEKGLLPDIGLEVTKLADRTLKIFEQESSEPVFEKSIMVEEAPAQECFMPETNLKEDGMCQPGECQCSNDVSDIFGGLLVIPFEDPGIFRAFLKGFEF